MNEFETNDELSSKETAELKKASGELGNDDLTGITPAQSDEYGLPLNLETTEEEADLTEFPQDLEVKVGHTRLNTVMMQTQPTD